MLSVTKQVTNLTERSSTELDPCPRRTEEITHPQIAHISAGGKDKAVVESSTTDYTDITDGSKPDPDIHAIRPSVGSMLEPLIVANGR